MITIQISERQAKMLQAAIAQWDHRVGVEKNETYQDVEVEAGTQSQRELREVAAMLRGAVGPMPMDQWGLTRRMWLLKDQ